jgi:hypothetical protein
MRTDGIESIHSFPVDKMQLYLSYSPPSDDNLVKLIQKALINVDLKNISLQFHLEIKN